MVDWPEPLIRDLARRRVVIVLGSGVSRHARNPAGERPPTWKEFLQNASAACPTGVHSHINDAIATGDYLHACEWLKRQFDEQWNEYLTQTFQMPGFTPASIHEEILKLDSRIIFSLNFDTIYERCAQNMKAGSHTIKQYYDQAASDYLRGPNRYIVKVHGSIDAPEKLIFTQQDYALARVRYSSFYKSFDAALLSNTFLFIGAGYSDPDVNLILENQSFSFPSSMPHYFMSSVGGHADLKESLRRNRNLKTIEYDRVDDDHSGLVNEISSLVSKVEDARMDLTTTINW